MPVAHHGFNLSIRRLSRPEQTKSASLEAVLHPQWSREPLISIPAQLPSSLAFISGSQELHDAYRSPGFLFELGCPQHFPARRPLIWFPPSPEGRSHCPAAPGMLCQLHLPPCRHNFQHWRPQGALARALLVSHCPGAPESCFSQTPSFLTICVDRGNLPPPVSTHKPTTPSHF